MIRSIVLDTTPLFLLCLRSGKPTADSCRQWVKDCSNAGCTFFVPEVADYEVRRELIRSSNAEGLKRLDNFSKEASLRYLPITTPAMRLAADLWAQVRNVGLPTADTKSLDADVILVAQSLQLGLPPPEMMIATSNVRHIARFVAADLWENIVP